VLVSGQIMFSKFRETHTKCTFVNNIILLYSILLFLRGGTSIHVKSVPCHHEIACPQVVYGLEAPDTKFSRKHIE
jgi:hypothetical protein